MSDYFDRLEIELRAAVPRVAASTAAPIRNRLRFHLKPGAVMTGVSVALTVTVVALAIALVGHGHKAARPPGPTAPRLKAPPATRAVPTLQQLFANFAILRRPQTDTDLSGRADLSFDSVARQLPKLTRLARRLSNGDRVYVSLEQLRTPMLGQAAGTYSMTLWVVDRHGETGSANYGRDVGYTIPPMEFPAPGHQTGRAPVWTSLVPDGVTRVSWTFACDDSSTPCLDHHPVTVRPSVHDNIASASVPRTGGCIGASVPCRPPAAVTWYGSGGQVIATFAGQSLVPAVAPFVQTGTNAPGKTSTPQP